MREAGERFGAGGADRRVQVELVSAIRPVRSRWHPPATRLRGLAARNTRRAGNHVEREY